MIKIVCVIHPISINRTWPICRWNFMWLDQVIAIYRWPNPTQMNNKGFYDFCKWNGFACSLTHSFTFCMYVCVSVFILCTCSHKICLLQYIRSVYLVSEVFFILRLSIRHSLLSIHLLHMLFAAMFISAKKRLSFQVICWVSTIHGPESFAGWRLERRQDFFQLKKRGQFTEKNEVKNESEEQKKVSSSKIKVKN